MQTDIPLLLSAARDECLVMMSKAGYPIKSDVAVQLDPTLQFMGYTTEVHGTPVIVVSPMAIDPGPLNGLLIHEMGHIYRTQTNHPSHTHKDLAEAMNAFLREHALTEEYQVSTLASCVNTLQDLYADDLSFKVYQQNPKSTFPAETFADFFAGWIKHPVYPDDSLQMRWNNALSCVNTAFAISNMKRHHLPDSNKTVENAKDIFLAELPPQHAVIIPQLVDLLTDLPKDPTKNEFDLILQKFFNLFYSLTSE